LLSLTSFKVRLQNSSSLRLLHVVFTLVSDSLSTFEHNNCLCIITGDKQYEQPYNRIRDTIDIQECTKLNLDTQNFDFDFFPNFNVCSNVYNESETRVKTTCDNLNDDEFCSLTHSFEYPGSA
jgi:hypothetical protein